MRVGDVLREGIVIGYQSGEVEILRAGVVVIHRSRLRRALRLGWHLREQTADPKLVMVERRP